MILRLASVRRTAFGLARWTKSPCIRSRSRPSKSPRITKLAAARSLELGATGQPRSRPGERMPSRIIFNGLNELRGALRNLPVDLRDDAQAIVSSHADAAATKIRDAYPIGPSRFFKKLNYR